MRLAMKSAVVGMIAEGNHCCCCCCRIGLTDEMVTASDGVFLCCVSGSLFRIRELALSTLSCNGPSPGVCGTQGRLYSGF